MPKSDFVAIDIETANADMASICQVGLVIVRDGVLTDEWKSYVDPEDFFDGMNISIHGIDSSVVKGAPTFSELANELYPRLENETVVCHTHFDRVSIHQAASKYQVQPPKCDWLDSARVARRAWTECSRKGYGLRDLCERLSITFRHHDALEDARACAQVMLAASTETGLEISDWGLRVRQPIDSSGTKIQREGNFDGDLFGQTIVFTGALEIPRREAADMAAAIGCRVASGVSKKVTLLVVGDQDITKLAGHEKSSKHRKAEDLISEGIPIRILRETDFKELVAASNTNPSS